MLIRWSVGRQPFHVRLASTHRRARNLSERYKTLENVTRVKPGHDSPRLPNGPDAVPSKPLDTIAGFMTPKPPRPPSEDECCMSGCAVCVYDLYEDALATYKEEVVAFRAALAEQDIPETEWPTHIRTGSNGGDATAPKTKSVLDAFEEMERALQAKREKRATTEAESVS